MTLLLVYFLVALAVSFLCSVLEAVLLSVTPSFIALAERDGQPIGKRLRELKQDIDRPLAAILSLNTVAHTVGAAGAGAQAALVFEDVPLGVISGVLTLGILVVSEVVPKTLGAVHWRSLARWVVPLLGPVTWAMWPLVKLSQGVSRLLSPRERRSSVSREELAALAELGTQEGVLGEDEARILLNLFRLGSLRVESVMTPRVVLFTLPADARAADVVREHPEIRFSRIPLHGESADEIGGYVLKSDVLLRVVRGEGDVRLSALARELPAVPASLPLSRLLDRMLERRESIALVVDEYGGTEGVVTMEDALETLLGLEIVDEADSVADMQELARQRWLRRARRLGLLDRPDLDRQQVEALVRLGLTGQKAGDGSSR